MSQTYINYHLEGEIQNYTKFLRIKKSGIKKLESIKWQCYLGIQSKRTWSYEGRYNWQNLRAFSEKRARTLGKANRARKMSSFLLRKM